MGDNYAYNENKYLDHILSSYLEIDIMSPSSRSVLLA